MAEWNQLKRCSALYRAIRDWFYAHDYTEVVTPIKIHAPAPEEYIESVCAENDFLRTSPELAMKILLSQGADKIFQIGNCFRANESGSRHREEFIMLEFYERGMYYRDQARFTAAMIAEAARKVLGSTRIEYRGNPVNLDEFEFVTVNDAFERFAGCSAAEADANDRFDELMVTRIEPRLGRGRLTFLCDYPANRASLARLRADDPAVAERWELYIEGIELANAFGELTDPAEQRERFRQALAFRAAAGMHPYPEAVEFFEALDRGLPDSSGCALGIDRLSMIFCNTPSLLSFHEKRK